MSTEKLGKILTFAFFFLIGWGISDGIRYAYKEYEKDKKQEIKTELKQEILQELHKDSLTINK